MELKNHILAHPEVLEAVLADYSGRFVSRKLYNEGKTYGYVTNLQNQNIAVEYTHYKNQLKERHALSDKERFDFDNQMIKKYIPAMAERVAEIEREEGSALRREITSPIKFYFDPRRPGRDESGKPCEFLVVAIDKEKGVRRFWIADGREAAFKYVDLYSNNLLARLYRYEKGRPAGTGHPEDVTEATPNNTKSITPPPENVNGGEI